MGDIFRKNRMTYSLIVMAIYVVLIIFLGRWIPVSALFLVLLPVLAISMGYGLFFGLLAGILSMPVNLLLYSILKLPEFTTGSAITVEILGLVIGGVIGFMSDYFSNLDGQIQGSHELSEELSRRIQDKEVLIQEVHHRVKNNLTLILSLIQLQESSAHSKELGKAMHVISQRISTIASVHDHIYTQETNTSVNLQRHLPVLCNAIIDSYQIPNLEIQEDLQFHTGISVQKATPLSLIILEILTNSCKHAFSPEQPEPRIFLHGRDTEKELILIISDNGKQGLHEKTKEEPGSGGLGSMIITALAKQIHATLHQQTERGYEYVIKMPKHSLSKVLPEDSTPPGELILP